MNYEALLTTLGVEGRVSLPTADGHLELRACCPLHDERSPSWSMNIVTGQWFCQAQCGGGSFPELVRRVLDCSWLEALSWMRSEGRVRADVGEMLQDLRAKLDELGGEQAHSTAKESAAESVSAAWNYYQSLDFSTIPIAMLRRGFSYQMLSQWGVRYDEGRELLVIPVTSRHQFVGYVARQMRPDASPRFINSQFNKAAVLFGLDRIPQRDAKTILFVEGPLKAIWAQAAGLPAVATFGDQVSELQLRQAGCDEFVLGLDNDAAGIAATAKLGAILPSQAVSVLRYPDGVKDADECTPEQLRELWSQRTSYLAWQIERVKTG